MKNPERAAIYCRISDDSDGRGLGVERQEHDCRAWADANGWTVAEVYVDNDVSAFSGKRRAAYERMLGDIVAGKRDGLVTFANDRLTRHPVELERFIDVVNAAGIPIRSLTGGEYDLSTTDGRLMARITGSVARAESERKSDRAKAKHAQLLREGKSPGGFRPFGLSQDRMSLVEPEATMLREAATGIVNGTTTLGAVLRRWNEAGVTTTQGRPWRYNTLARMLTGELYVGRRQGLEMPWPKILDERTHIALVEQFKSRKHGRVHSPTLLSRIARCGRCGHFLVSQPKSGGIPAYICPQKDHYPEACSKLRILGQPLDDLITARMFSALSDYHPEPTEAEEGDQEALEKIQRLEAVANELADMLGAGEMSREAYKRASLRNEEALAEARARLAHSVRVAVDSAALDLPALQEKWPEMDIEEKRRIIERVYGDGIVIKPGRRGYNRFDPTRVVAVPRWGNREVLNAFMAVAPRGPEVTDEDVYTPEELAAIRDEVEALEVLGRALS